MAKRDGEEAAEDREDGQGHDGDEDGYQAWALSQARAEHLKHGGHSIQLFQWPCEEGTSHSHFPEPRVTPRSVELHTPHISSPTLEPGCGGLARPPPTWVTPVCLSFLRGQGQVWSADLTIPLEL